MAKWKLKGCPRCKGDLLVERLEGKWDEYCLQCGYRRDLKVVSPRVPLPDGVTPTVPVENSQVTE
ncbi:MAG: hypothetical protein A2147_02795 [Chloroflexi bacterium RBG_16_57_8]|nr:MAG: hypothetical protein A2147_02795 [Chloroflexi bacterium RBG_16_57_8]